MSDSTKDAVQTTSEANSEAQQSTEASPAASSTKRANSSKTRAKKPTQKSAKTGTKKSAGKTAKGKNTSAAKKSNAKKSTSASGKKRTPKKSVVDDKVAGILTTSLVDNKRLPKSKTSYRYIDKIDEYKENVAPIITELMRACYRAKIPFFIAFALADNGEKTMYHNEILTPITLGLKPLSDDQLHRFIQVLQGYRVVPTSDEMEIEIDTDGTMKESGNAVSLTDSVNKPD